MAYVELCKLSIKILRKAVSYRKELSILKDLTIEGTKMDKVQQLTQILKRLNSGEDPTKVRQEAKEFLATIDAKDLSVAEQNLVEEGLSTNDLQRLCSINRNC